MSDGRQDHSPSRLAGEWQQEIRVALTAGHCFRAYDLCHDALQSYPDDFRLSLLSALAALHCGDIGSARAVIGVLADRVTTADDAELMAEICHESWRRQGATPDLLLASEMASRAYHLGATGTRAFLAAVLAEIGGRHDEALSFAVQAVARGDVDDAFYAATRAGLLGLLQGDDVTALAAFNTAGVASRTRYALRVPARRVLADLAAGGLALPDGIDAAMPAPTVVLFSGPQIDIPGHAAGGFPLALEAGIAAAIALQLEGIGAEIGYSCAAPGADLLFVEAMLARDAEINLALPCSVDDFLAHWVRPAGARWEALFQRAISRAASVLLTTTDPLYFDAEVLQYNNRVIDGITRLRAHSLGCKPYLLTVWDYKQPALPGSVSDFIDHWGDPARLRMIDLDSLRQSAWLADAALPDVSEQSPGGQPEFPRRVVRAMLFADIVGYSKLNEVHLPALWRYMADLGTRLTAQAPRPLLVESWGDALYVVQADARAMADYALALLEGFAALDSSAYGLPENLSIRIGVHAGPVFPGVHPLTGRDIIYGSQVTRAARIEPISKPGMIYASEQFVAALIAGESLREGKQEDSETLASDYHFDYLGTQDLAKNYGRQAVYLLRRSAVLAQP